MILETLRNGLVSSHAHQRIEIAPCQPIGQVAMCVAKRPFDDGKIRFEPTFQHIGLTLKFLNLLACRQFRAIARWGKERRKTRASRANAFRQRALRNSAPAQSLRPSICR